MLTLRRVGAVTAVDRVLGSSGVWSRVAGLLLVALVAALVYATGGHRSHFEDLYLLVLVSTAAFHASARFVEIAVATLIAIALPFAYAGWSRDDLSELLVAAPLWLVAAGIVHVRTQQLRRSRYEQARAQQVREQFVSVTSHELRTPLTAIRGAIGLLEAGLVDPASEKGKRALAIASENADRLVRLVNDLLDLERLDSGRLTIVPAPTLTDRMVREAIDAVGPLASEAEVRVETEIGVDEVVCDRDRIVQTLTNLLTNSVKFSPPGSTIRLQVADAADEVVFRVIDHGRGIPEHQLEAVFERFAQVDVDDARSKGGSGLGLPICRTIVQQHGGTIWAERRSGGGTTMTFTLPRVPST